MTPGDWGNGGASIVIKTWDEYRRLPDAADGFLACHKAGRSGYARQRDILKRVLDKLKPRRVACLGAGLLNDIPYRDLVHSGATIHLVDWLPGGMDTGIRLSIVEEDEGPDCTYCHLSDEDARAYCRRFRRFRDRDKRVCQSFEPGAGEFPTCEAFQRGDLPVLHDADVTAGYAQAFAQQVPEIVARAGNWKQALRGAWARTRQIGKRSQPLDIPEQSVDLVTSVLVMSQFEHEPYAYFSRQATNRLGPPTAREEKRLQADLERLRSNLLEEQIDRHCREIARILAPGGYCIMAFELFHLDSTHDRWFLVEEMYRGLKIVERHLDFSGDLLPESDAVCRFEQEDSASLVYYFALKPPQGS